MDKRTKIYDLPEVAQYHSQHPVQVVEPTLPVEGLVD
jgi:hypothetical protein